MMQPNLIPKSTYNTAAMLEKLPIGYQLLAEGILIGLDTARKTSMSSIEDPQETANDIAG